MKIIHVSIHSCKIRVIGRGSYGRAILARKRPAYAHHAQPNYKSELIVLKEINLSRLTSPSERKEARQEVKILKSLKHSNIIRCTDSFEDNGYLYIVTEYADGGMKIKKTK